MQPTPFYFSDNRCLSSAFKRGVTLVELLVVMGLALIISSVALILYQNSSRDYVRQDAVIRQVQNMRVGLYAVTRDLRMAGSGYGVLGQVDRLQLYDVANSNWFFDPKEAQVSGETPYGAWPVFGVDGGASGTDSLTVCWFGPESGASIGALADNQKFVPGTSATLYLRDAPSDDEVQAGDIIALASEGKAMAFEAKIVSGNQITLTDGAFFPGKNLAGFDFNPGTRVYNLKTVRLVKYSVDSSNNTLVADIVGGVVADDTNAPITSNRVVVATDIEDLQVRYIAQVDVPTNANGGITYGTLPLDNVNQVTNSKYFLANTPLKAVEVGLVSRSSIPEQSGAKFARIDLFNHRHGGAKDTFRRRAIQETIQLRNFSN